MNYPSTYQNSGNYYSPPQMPNVINGINWCQGETSAKAWPVAPGTGVVLLDSEDNVMYIKYADQMGRPILLKKKYEDYIEPQPMAISSRAEPDMTEYVKRQDIEDMISREVERRMADSKSSRQNGGRNGNG